MLKGVRNQVTQLHSRLNQCRRRLPLPAVAFAGVLLALACAPQAPPGEAGAPEPWPTAPQPRRTPLPLPTPTVPPPTAEPTATRGPFDFVGRQRARVLRVWDGQSALLEGGMTVRYLGVQAPPAGTFGRPSTPGGIAAAQRNADLVEGKEVELEQDVTEVDGDGQLPRYVWVDGEMVNKELLAAGLVQAAVADPDLRYQEDLLAAEREAWEARRGVWVNAPTMTRTLVVRPRATFRPAPPAPAAPAPQATSIPTAGPPSGDAPAPRFGGEAPPAGQAPAPAAPAPQPTPAPAAAPAAPAAPVAPAAPAAPAAPQAPAPPAIPRFGE
jgi:endonuclease YncB( thermonuclease family)